MITYDAKLYDKEFMEEEEDVFTTPVGEKIPQSIFYGRPAP